MTVFERYIVANIKPVKWALTCCIPFMLASAVLQAKPLTLYYNEQQQPKAWIDEQYQPNGFAYEIAAAILNKAQIDFIASAVPFVRGIENTKLCEGIMTGVFKTEDREGFLTYSNAIVPDNAVVVSRREDEFIYSGLQDLRGHRVAYLRGASFGNAFDDIEPELDKETHQDPATMLRLLAFKRVDLVILNPGLATVKVAAKAAKIKMNRLRVSRTPLAQVENYLVSCKHLPKTYNPLIKRINEAIKTLKQDGSFDEIMEKY